jgi:hypothetical protein
MDRCELSVHRRRRNRRMKEVVSSETDTRIEAKREGFRERRATNWPSSEKGKPTVRWGHKVDGSHQNGMAGLPEQTQNSTGG